MSEANKQLVRDFVDAWNRVDWDAVVGMMTDDIAYHNVPWEPVNGREAVRENLLSFGVEESAWVIHHIVGEGNIVMTERTDHVVMNGKPCALPAMGVFEIENGKIKAWRDYFDPAQI